MMNYAKIFKAEAKEILGNDTCIDISTGATRFQIYGRYKGGSGYHIHTIDLAGEEDEIYFVLGGCKFSDREFFKEWARQIIEIKVKPAILTTYRNNNIAKLPPKMEFTETFNLNNITEEWFLEEFNKIAEDVSNMETASNIVISKKPYYTISFDMNDGRVSYGCLVTINNKGVVKVDMDETPVEGADLPSDLKDSIEARLQNETAVEI